ncbi:uncharacterized protein N7484_010365 [Penicillium longicatenatum]|uniref:uncharacterized protein n=1 Tax=Penicillium longicatenatum TaxID=1561947 RepID=UPI0025477A2E|nr:uncharacterized protein N7484_010365 [Penicillium longicatenatum]KAJ5630265.1 hypothetical protein N7484_010365 [Penicillium longicatenatum]
MRLFKSRAPPALVALCALSQPAYSAPTSSSAAVVPGPTMIDFDDDGVVGGLYRPSVNSARSSIAVYVMHAESDYLSISACTELPQRGLTTLCANNAADKTGVMSTIYFEDELTQVDQGMRYLRNLTGIDKVVLFGHSGGGAMMAGYQDVAENGVSACQGPEKIHNCTDSVAGLLPADGIMLIDANYGLGSMPSLSLNPALTGPHGTTVNQTLNLFNPANGFVNGASSNFTADFKKRYQAAVVKRNNDIISYAQDRLAKIESGKTGLTDDEPFYITNAAYGTMNNKFFPQDLNYIAHTTYPWKLLHKDGKITNQIVHTVRVPVNFESYATSYMQGALKTTIRRFLGTFAIRAGDDFEIMADGFKGIDFASNQFSPSESIKGVVVPLLNMGMTGHWEYLNAEKIHLNAASNDTDIAFVDGATHMIATCLECEKYPG